MKTYYFFLFIALLVTSGCGNDPATNNDSAPASAPPAASTPVEGTTYPSLPMDRFQYLWDNSNYSDATYYYLPISTNQSTQEQVRGSLSYVSTVTPVVPSSCKAIGHLWYQVNGENVEEADIYFSEGCTFYVWYENGQPTYANALTDEGIKFYNNIIASAAQQQQQQQQ